MTRLILVDDSALLALTDQSHPHHSRAALFLETSRIRNYQLLTVTPILIHVCDLIRSRFGAETAATVADALRNSTIIRVESLSEDDLEEAWRIFRTTEDREWLFHRCSAAALMNRLNIDTLFSFEESLSKHGYKLLPEVPR